jgi:3-dehydroquinate synthase
MKIIDLRGEGGRSTVIIGASIADAGAYCDLNRTVIVTDTTVRAIHGRLFPGRPVIEIGTGEQCKTLKTVAAIYEQFLRLEVDRSWSVLAIGGGVVCDVAGFAASTYLRGLRFGCIPTTLLAQVDAGVGGKNGVNLNGYKNAVGTFNQPSFVLCDPDLLATLPASEVQSGIAELIKAAAIGDARLFSFMEATDAALFSLDRNKLEQVVHDALKVKCSIVARDEKEQGERRKLNFGHTVGHAVEKAHGLRHGEAVSIGMAVSARLSVARGLLSAPDGQRLERLLAVSGLPTRAPLDGAAVMDALRKDKKREGSVVHFVLLDGIGSATVTPLEIDEIEDVVHDLC